MVLLLSLSDLNEWQHQDSGGEEDLGVEVDPSDISQHLPVHTLNLLVVLYQRLETVF